MKVLPIFALVFSIFLSAADHPDFSGTWEFSSAKSKNVGMMADMKLTAVVKQTPNELVITNLHDGRQSSETRFNLMGEADKNVGPMGDKAETTSKWEGSKLVTTWTSPGAVAGTQTVRIETRSLSADGRLLTIESVRGKNPPMVMVYERK